VGIGLSLYDLLSAGAGWPRHRMVRAGLAGMPEVDAAAFPRAGLYCDAQLLFPERFTVELLVDARDIAAAAGTRFDVCTYRHAEVGRDGVLRIGPSPAGDGPLEVRPDAIVNATGAWVDRALAAVFPGGAGGVGRRLIGGTKGSHLVVRWAPLRAALADYGVYAEAADGRPVFVLPFGPELVLVGTTDLAYSGDPAEARTDEAEIDYLLMAVTRLFPSVAVRRDHVQQHYCGVRPLPYVGGDARSPAGVTRRHLVVRQDGAAVPLWSIVGGKLTTCRSLAEATAATVLGSLGLPVLRTSRERPLPGACSGAAREAVVRTCRAHAERAGLSADRAAAAAEHAVGLFGARAAGIWQHRGDSGGLSTLIRGVDLPRAAVGCCVHEEWASTLDDLIERRLMLSFHERLSREAITDVAESLANARGLVTQSVAAAVDGCVARLEERYGRSVPITVEGPGLVGTHVRRTSNHEGER
jgi:glycerol-3-phosphate dehydrogenase